MAYATNAAFDAWFQSAEVFAGSILRHKTIAILLIARSVGGGIVLCGRACYAWSAPHYEDVFRPIFHHYMIHQINRPRGPQVLSRGGGWRFLFHRAPARVHDCQGRRRDEG